MVSQEVILDRILEISYFEKLSVSSEAYWGGEGREDWRCKANE